MAPPLDRLNIGNGLTYFKLAEFNNTVLAYNFIKSPFPEIHYVTWQRTGANSFDHGHYFSSDNDALNEQQAMRDFCVRSGLIRKCDLLANENLPDFVAMIDRLRSKPQSLEDEKLLDKFKEQADKIMSEPKEMVVDKEMLMQSQEPIEADMIMDAGIS